METLIVAIPMAIVMCTIIYGRHRRERKRKNIILMEKALGVYPIVKCHFCKQPVYADSYYCPQCYKQFVE